MEKRGIAPWITCQVLLYAETIRLSPITRTETAIADVTGHAELIVAKQRHGATGKIRLHFDSHTTRFSDPVQNIQLAA